MGKQVGETCCERNGEVEEKEDREEEDRADERKDIGISEE
jgi:hypothetical protein